jgi:hypothetical protein
VHHALRHLHLASITSHFLNLEGKEGPTVTDVLGLVHLMAERDAGLVCQTVSREYPTKQNDGFDHVVPRRKKMCDRSVTGMGQFGP